MSVPPDQMGAPPPPGGEGAAAAPGGAPNLTPQQPKGEQASADASVQVALRMLEHSLAAHGSKTEKGQAIMKAIVALTKGFGHDEEKAQAIMPAEIKTALMAPGGGAEGGGPPGGAPPGMPPGGAPPGMPPG